MRIDVNEIEASRPEDREVALLAAEIRRLQRVIDAGEPTLTDAERDRNGAVNVRENDHIPDAGKMVPAITAAEREAIETAIVGRLELADFATLRKLLERLT
jgi:hypothetical protein